MKPSLFLACALAVVAVAGCNSKPGDAATNAATAELKPVPPPKSGDWSEIVTPTPAGGFLMGNPTAPIKLVEYGSMTCPHCREFDEKGMQPLIDTYVKSGRVSFEFRNFVRDGFDLAASLVARCNGAKGFFPLTRALYKDQPNWIAKLQAAPQQQLEALSNLPPNQQFLEIAKLTGFQNWAAMRGVPAAKTQQCLTDQKQVDQLVQMNSDATDQYPEFPGTPTFILNGKMLDKTASWETLEPQLRQAAGERG